MSIITSLQNPRIKDAVRLRDRRHREKQGRILIDGAREIYRAIRGGCQPLEAFVCPALCHGDEAQQALAELHSGETELIEVTEPVFEKLAFGNRSEGVLAVAEMPHPTLATLKLPEKPLIAILEDVEKPGNVGAVLRSADAAGLDAVVLADPRTDPFNPNAIRASLGTIFSMPLAVATADETLAWLRQQQINVFAARVEGAVCYTEVDYRGPAAVVLGSEANGLSDLWSGSQATAIRLPMLGIADSLNVSVAAGVLFYEARRQRSA